MNANKMVFCLVLLVVVIFPVTAQDYYGIFSLAHRNNEMIPDTHFKIYSWDHTCELSDASTNTTKGISVQFNGNSTWFGFGFAVIPEGNFADLSRYDRASLKFTLITSPQYVRYLEFGMKSGRNNESWLFLENKYIIATSMKNNARKYSICIPIQDFRNQQSGFNLRTITQYFMARSVQHGKGEIPSSLNFIIEEIYLQL
jgi:hypothetical protein